MYGTLTGIWLRLKRTRGVALVVVLTGIAILAAFSTEFTYRSRVDIKVATNLEKRVQAYFHARSAMEIARLVVTSQKMVDNAIAAFGGMMPGGSASNRTVELWRFAAKFTEVFNSSSLNFLGVDLMDLKEVQGVGVKEGGFELEIVPEDSRINVNAGSTASDRKQMFTKIYPLLAGQIEDAPLVGMDRKAAELILNMLDWTDPDDERSDIDSNGNLVSAGGAGENVDYSKYGYKARNARMDSVEELRLIEGMTDELFCKFGELFTVYQTEQINVNEADLFLLKALMCDNLLGNAMEVCGQNYATPNSLMDQAMLQLEMCRRIKKSLYLPPFSSANAFVDFWNRLPAPLNLYIKVNANTLRPMVGTQSKILRVRATGWVGATGHEITAVIDQGSTNYLHWRERGFDASGKKNFGVVKPDRPASAGDKAAVVADDESTE